jgi:hypothetical protein
MFSTSNDTFKTKVEKKIRTICDSITARITDNWAIDEDEYNKIARHCEYVAQYGDLDQRKMFCHLLYEARVKTEHDAMHSGYYLALEFYFRQLCSPDLDKESSFMDCPLPYSCHGR